METLTSKQRASFYCNRCDKRVDGIEDKDNSSDIAGMKQVLCDECGGAILYKLPGFWKKLQRRMSQYFANSSGPAKK